MGRNSILQLKFWLWRNSPAEDPSINSELSWDVDGILSLTSLTLLTSYSFQHKLRQEWREVKREGICCPLLALLADDCLCLRVSQGPHSVGDWGHLEACWGDRALWLMFPIQPQIDYNVACFLWLLRCPSNRPASHLISIKTEHPGSDSDLIHCRSLASILQALCSSFFVLSVPLLFLLLMFTSLLLSSSLLVSRILSCGVHFSCFFLGLLSFLPYAHSSTPPPPSEKCNYLTSFSGLPEIQYAAKCPEPILVEEHL